MLQGADEVGHARSGWKTVVAAAFRAATFWTCENPSGLLVPGFLDAPHLPCLLCIARLSSAGLGQLNLLQEIYTAVTHQAGQMLVRPAGGRQVQVLCSSISKGSSSRRFQLEYVQYARDSVGYWRAGFVVNIMEQCPLPSSLAA